MQHHSANIEIQRIGSDADRRAELRAGLLQSTARISPKFFYDTQGCALYQSLCLLPEYYPPRLEASICDAHQANIAATLPTGAQLIDLGCGDGAKAWRWIEALNARRYIGVDIAGDCLRETLLRSASRFPTVEFSGVVTDFTRGLDLRAKLAEDCPKVFFYPGTSIGNFERTHAVQFLREVRAHLRDRDRILIGADCTKPREPLIAAYADELGITAAFNLNVLRVVNSELGTDFRIADFEHRAVFDEAHCRVEMHLVARRSIDVKFDTQGTHRRLEAGEAIVTEYSHKYSVDQFRQLLSEAGFGDIRHWTDDRQWYGFYVAAPASH